MGSHTGSRGSIWLLFTAMVIKLTSLCSLPWGTNGPPRAVPPNAVSPAAGYLFSKTGEYRGCQRHQTNKQTQNYSKINCKNKQNKSPSFVDFNNLKACFNYYGEERVKPLISYFRSSCYKSTACHKFKSHRKLDLKTLKII